MKLLKRLILTKQRKEYAKTDKDQIADFRTDLALDLKKIKDGLVGLKFKLALNPVLLYDHQLFIT